MSGALNTRSFATLVAEVQRVIQDTQSTNLRLAAKDALNRALDAAASMYDWPQLVQADESGLRKMSDTTLPSLMAGDSFMPAPFASGRLHSMLVQSTIMASPEIVPADELYARAGISAAFETGVPRYVAQVGETAQYRALAADDQPTCFCSTDANDGIKTVRVYFQKASGYIGQRNWTDVSGAFSSGVLLGGGVRIESGYPIKAVSLPVGWAGHFTIVSTAGVTLVDVQSVEEPATNTNSLPQIAKRALFKVFPTPDTDYGATVVWWRVPLLLTEDEDIPELPIGSYLVARAAADIFGQQGKLAEMQLWEGRAISALRATVQQNTGTKRQGSRPAHGNIIDGTGYRWYSGSNG